MKKAFWWILGILLSPIILFVLLTILIYLPPVQNWAVDKVAAIATEKTGIDISIDRVRLSFPLDLQVVGLKADSNYIDRLTLDVKLRPLFQKKVVIKELEVSNARINTGELVEAALVKGTVGRLYATSRGIDLDAQSVELNGTQIDDARIAVWMNDSVPEDTTTSETLWKIAADTLTVRRADIKLFTPGDTMSVAMTAASLMARNALIDLGTQTYTVGSVDWQDGTLQYDQTFEPRIEELDFNHIDLSNVNIGIDSIYYHDPTLRLFMRNVAMKEKSGMQITGLSGALSMENGTISLPSFNLKTPTSNIYVNMDMPLSLMDLKDPGNMRMRIDASIGREDLMMFMKDMPKELTSRWPAYPLNVKGSAWGNMEHLEFNDLDIELPTAFHATASGFVNNATDLKNLRADVTFNAQSHNLGFLMGILPADMRHNYRLPPMSANGRVKANGEVYSADVALREGRGLVKATGSFDQRLMKYDAKMKVQNLNINHFMPHDSIYTVTADIDISGQGTDFMSPSTRLTANADIGRIDYGQLTLTDVGVQANLSNGHAIACIESRNELLSGTINLDALLGTNKLEGNVSTDIRRADLYAMGLMEQPLTLSLCGAADITSDMNLNNYVSGLISDIVIRDSADSYHSEFIGLHAQTSADTTLLRVQSGDLIVKLDASGTYMQLMDQMQTFTDTLAAQYHARVIDQPALRRQLPRAKVHIQSYRNNPVSDFMRAGMGMEFKDLLFDMACSPEQGVNGNGSMHALTVSDIRLDTINFRITQRKERLSFGGQICNNKKNPQFVFNALFDGVLQERGATMGVRYYDATGKMGARLGAQAEMVDEGINFHFIPEHPILGYKEFNLNSDNFLLIEHSGHIRANIDLISKDYTGLQILSDDTDSTTLQDLTFSVTQLNLAEITSVLPYMPQVSGVMNGDYHIVQDLSGRISVAGEMGVQKMAYEGSPIGNISTEMVYLQKGDTAHAVEARIMMDDTEVGLLTGTYYDRDDGFLDAKFIMEKFPLSLANGFVPDQMIGLEGYGHGELSVRGKASAPTVNGEMALESSYLVSIPYGMRLRFDDTPVHIINSVLNLQDFKVHAPQSETPLTVNGSVDFSDTEKIMVDLRMRARDFQIINEKENPKSVAYGKGFVNLFAIMKGQLDNMSMRGRMEVLGKTDMSYILRDSPLNTDNQLDELVRFTDFSDSTQTVVEKPAITGFSMDMTLDVSKGAHIMAYLNTDHSNYIDLMGGGTIRMRFTPADGMQLYGKYTLSNGEMKYSMPVIPLKTFSIKDGSYIEFTGEPMNPTLNISASERMKATVTDASGVGRSVEFDCGVTVSKTLSNMGLEFSLDAPEDMQLHSELQAMSVEQRGKLAVSMLTTGMYLSDGSTGSFSMNSALSSFLSSEISQITGNALRTLDLSVGMDNATDATGNTHTDYSFKFAKRFFNNRVKLAVGGKVSTGAEIQERNNSFFDNVTMEYRLDDTANKYVSVFYQNNSYDWLDGYTQKYGGGFIWRRSLQHITDLFRLKDPTSTFNIQPRRTQPDSTTVAKDSTTVRP